MRRLAMAMLLSASVASAVIIDQIAIVIGNSIIKDSDISRDLRVTEFLNNAPLNLSLAARKKAASRLIDQVFIRREIQIGDYPEASWKQANEELDKLRQQRFKTDGAFNQALHRYGLAPIDLRTQFQWQLTILSFIDIRFKPAVMVTDEEIDKYYNQHRPELERAYPGKASLDDLRQEIRNRITEQKVNRQFFSWLDAQRKDNKIQYLEADLK